MAQRIEKERLAILAKRAASIENETTTAIDDFYGAAEKMLAAAARIGIGIEELRRTPGMGVPPHLREYQIAALDRLLVLHGGIENFTLPSALFTRFAL